MLIYLLIPRNINKVHFSKAPSSVRTKFKDTCFDNNLYLTHIPIYQINFGTLKSFRYKNIISKQKLINGKLSHKPLYKDNYAIINLELIEILNKLKHFLQEKGHSEFTIISWFRFPTYNNQINGAKCSLHTSGKAVDIKHPNPEIIIKFLNKHYPNTLGIGTYPNYPNSIHIDIRKTKTRW